MHAGLRRTRSRDRTPNRQPTKHQKVRHMPSSAAAPHPGDISYHTRNTFNLQSQLQLARTPSSYNDHPHPTTNSVCGSWMCSRCDPPGAGVVDHLHRASASHSSTNESGQGVSGCGRTLCMSCHSSRSRARLPDAGSTAPSAPHTRGPLGASRTHRRPRGPARPLDRA